MRDSKRDTDVSIKFNPRQEEVEKRKNRWYKLALLLGGSLEAITWHFCLEPIGQNWVTWPYPTAKEAEKFNLYSVLPCAQPKTSGSIMMEEMENAWRGCLENFQEEMGQVCLGPPCVRWHPELKEMHNITVSYGEGQADTGEVSIHQITWNLYSETYLKIECKLRSNHPP